MFSRWLGRGCDGEDFEDTVSYRKTGEVSIVTTGKIWGFIARTLGNGITKCLKGNLRKIRPVQWADDSSCPRKVCTASEPQVSALGSLLPDDISLGSTCSDKAILRIQKGVKMEEVTAIICYWQFMPRWNRSQIKECGLENPADASLLPPIQLSEFSLSDLHNDDHKIHPSS